MVSKFEGQCCWQVTLLLVTFRLAFRTDFIHCSPLSPHSFVLLASVICFASKHTALPEHVWELSNIWNGKLNLFNKYFSYYFNLRINFQAKLIILLITAFIDSPHPNTHNNKLKQKMLRELPSVCDSTFQFKKKSGGGRRDMVLSGKYCQVCSFCTILLII